MMPHMLAGGGLVGDHGSMKTPASRRKRPRSWRRLLIAGVVLAAVVLGAGVVVSSVLDLEKHRESVQQALEAQTGWSAQIAAIDFSLWRGLVVTAGPLELSDPESGSRLEADTVVVRASLGPLFAGRLEIDKVEILRPRVVLVVDADEIPALRPESKSSSSGDGSRSLLSVSIDEIHVKGGSVVIEAGEAGSLRRLEIGEVSALYAPISKTVWGRARVKGADTRIKWQGKLGRPINVDWEGLPSETLIPWLGDGLIHPGASISGETVWSPASGGGRLDATLQVKDLLLLEGEKPLPAVTVALRVSPSAAGWRMDDLEISSAHATVLGRGALFPLVDLAFEMQPAEPEHALALVRSIMPLPIAASGKGEAEATFGVRVGETGELLTRAEGTLRAQRVSVHSTLPEMLNFACTFRLSEDNVLTLDDLEGQTVGGRMRGSVRIEPAVPPGRATLEIDLSDAAPAALLGLVAPAQGDALSGKADIELSVGVDLTKDEISPAALTGAVRLDSKSLEWSGWESLRASVVPALQSVDSLFAALGSRSDVSGVADLLENRWSAVDRLALRLDFGQEPWRVEDLVVDAGDFALRGEGSFAPLGAGLDMAFEVKLSAEVSAQIFERIPWLGSLADDERRLVFPVSALGALWSPSFSLDFRRALLESGVDFDDLGVGTGAESSLEGLLGSWLEKKLEKKRDEKDDRP